MRIAILIAMFSFWGSANALSATAKPASRQSMERAAKKACATSDYQKGIDILADLYLDTNDAVYVYNQARCYQQNSRQAQAIDRFREYLRKAPDLTDAERADVEKHIAECESLLPKTPPEPTVVPREPPPVQPVSQPSASPAETLAAPSTVPVSSGSGLRVAGLVTSGIGLAAIATGVVLAAQTHSLTNDIQNSESGSYASKESRRASYETWGWVSYGVGAAAVATGAILYVVGRSSGGSSPRTEVSLLPTFVPGEARLILRGGF
jgi:tetratricopeptide (TPR) repeat protein